VTVITADGSGIHAGTFEAGSDTTLGDDWEMYDFSPALEPQFVSASDRYWEDHRRLSDEGRIKHSVENCPERTQPRIVREWDPNSGWREIRLPAIASHEKR
jgi:hypothetical protein